MRLGHPGVFRRDRFLKTFKCRRKLPLKSCFLFFKRHLLMGLKTCFGPVLQMKVFAKRVTLADPNIDCEVINWQSSHSLCRTTWDWLKPLFVLVGPTCWDNSGNGGWVFSQIKVTETVEQNKKQIWPGQRPGNSTYLRLGIRIWEWCWDVK